MSTTKKIHKKEPWGYVQICGQYSKGPMFAYRDEDVTCEHCLRRMALNKPPPIVIGEDQDD